MTNVIHADFDTQNRVLMIGFEAMVRSTEAGFKMLANRLDALERRVRIEASNREPRQKAFG